MPDELNKKNENEFFNPFDFGEVLHRKEYIILLIIFSYIMSLITMFMITNYAETTMVTSDVKNKIELYLIMFSSPKTFFIYTMLQIFSCFLFFVLNQKRILDILGESKTSKKNSYILALGILLIGFIGWFLPNGTLIQTVKNGLENVIILFLILKKGKYQENNLQVTTLD